jgi:hypothetical protein
MPCSQPSLKTASLYLILINNSRHTWKNGPVFLKIIEPRKCVPGVAAQLFLALENAHFKVFQPGKGTCHHLLYGGQRGFGSY